MSFCSRLIYFNQNKSLPKYRKANCCKKAFLHFGAGANTLCTPVFVQRGYRLPNLKSMVLHSCRTILFCGNPAKVKAGACTRFKLCKGCV